MAEEPLTLDNFWWHPYVRTLTAKGKLALFYLRDHTENMGATTLEDMALETGVELSECRAWAEQFIGAGVIDASVLMDQDL